MSRVWTRIIIFAVLLVALSASSLWAWHFSLSSSTSLSYLYFSQMGDNGFFGKYDRSTNPDFAVANGWLGNGMGMVSGADATTSSVSTSLFPTFWSNSAITVSGVYRIGNVPVDTFPGGGVSSASGEWLEWVATVETPWGITSFGKKPFGFGMGLQYDGTVRTEEHLTLVADKGPFQFGGGMVPSRTPAQLNPNRDFLDRPFTAYWNPRDASGTPVMDVLSFLHYASGPVEMGIGCLFNSQHMGPEGIVDYEKREHTPTMDQDSHEGWIYGRYDIGRFFIHAEADWFYRTVRFQKSLSGSFLPPPAIPADAIPENIDGSGSIFRPLYTESWRFAAETGVRAGPCRVSFLYAFVPGPDRRHGVLIDRQQVIVNPYLPNFDRIIFHPDHGNATLFRDYSAILVDDYASGVQALNRSREGYLADASAIAARIDYAVAANLNVYASAFHATRVSHGYGWGFISPVENRFSEIDVAVEPEREYASPVPAIPDNDLGWEFGAGFTWNLLEGFRVNLSASYWQPGNWFKYACVDRSVPDWDAARSFRDFPWGVNPNRSIDPVFGLNCLTSVRF